MRSSVYERLVLPVINRMFVTLQSEELVESLRAAVLFLCLLTSIVYLVPLSRFSIFNAWDFFEKRYDFILRHFRQSAGNRLVEFGILGHKVVAVRGEEARKAFFSERSLDFTEGYRILRGGAPELEDLDIRSENRGDMTWFSKHALQLLTKDRLTALLPDLYNDINARMVGWGHEGQVDLFDKIFSIVFQMTIRLASCRELSEDEQAVDSVRVDFDQLERNSNATSLLLPWLPSPSKKRKTAATKRLFDLLNKFVELRRHADVPSSDAIDVMLGHGYSNELIIEFLLGVITAGQANTGMISCWTILYLGIYPEWRQKAKSEILSLLSKDTDAALPMHARLASIALSEWESSLPVVDSVIREVLRLIVSGAPLRRNVDTDLKIGADVVPKGAFLTYLIADVHMDPEVYTDPEVFDPTRYAQGRQEDKRGAFAFLGWGA
ncbi:hypothetical protein EW146_g8249, partial [Bondarzewia mesenterica]